MISFAGFGHALPDREVSLEDLAEMHGVDAARLARSPGIKVRRYCTTESQVDLATRAALDALDDAGIDAGDVDVVISAAGVSYQPLPGMAPLIMREIGISDGAAEALDVNTTCLSFCSALDIAAMRLALRPQEVILIVSSEMASRGLPWTSDPETAALFGDGAAAAVITQGETRLLSRRFATYPSGWEACQIASGGTRLDPRKNAEAFEKGSEFAMNPRDLFRLTAGNLPRFVDEVLKDAGWTAGEVDTVVPHQASPLALTHMARACGFSRSQVIDIMEGHGNMIAASIPLALGMAAAEERLAPGRRILLLGTSAGVSFGGLALEIGGDTA